MAFAIEQIHNGIPGESVLMLLTALALLPLIFGLIGPGRLIKYMPYPVFSGYLAGAGLVIIGSQGPKLLGAQA